MSPGSKASAPTLPSGTNAAKPGHRPSRRAWIAVKSAVWILSLTPLGLLLFDAITGNLQADPVMDITHRTGWWTLTLLLVTLAVTPLRYLTGWKPIVRLRRPLGLFAFFYATLHMLVYFGLDQMLAFDYIVEDIAERPYITVGFSAWLLLIPLAVTSTKGWIRRLGKQWTWLHRLLYLVVALGLLHFYWLVKADIREPLVFAAIFAALMVFRIPAVSLRLK